MSYVIAEVTPDSRVGFAPRGGALQLWLSKEHEVIIAGPAETGKTWGMLQKLDALMWKYAGAQGALVRKTYASMHGTVLQTFRRILGPQTPVRSYGGDKPEWFDYPNGSRVFVGGMDNPQKVLSGERDVIAINQAEELELNDWETLTTRATGRASVMPYTQIMGDCNPGPATHWILSRPSLRVLYSRHEDNPTLFDEQGAITEQGNRTMAVLDALTGTRYKRLRLGLWVGAEGMVYEGWDRSIHLIDHVPDHPEWTKDNLPREWPRYRDIDFGFTNPFVCHWWAADPDGRLYLYRELYKTQQLVEDWATDINRLSQGETYQHTLADHDAEGRATLEKRGIRTTAANKAVQDGIQVVQVRLNPAHDGRPRLYIFRDCRVNDADQDLVDKHKPTCTAEEFDGYVWAKVRSTDTIKEEPRKQDDHGMDGMRYQVIQLDGVPAAAPVYSW